MKQPVFTHGQLYVAFSRVRSINNVKLLLLDTSNQGHMMPNTTNQYTNNIVYKEVLTTTTNDYYI